MYLRSRFSGHSPKEFLGQVELLTYFAAGHGHDVWGANTAIKRGSLAGVCYEQKLIVLILLMHLQCSINASSCIETCGAGKSQASLPFCFAKRLT